ncbi:hypothetical protein HYX18_02325 [Candidatus Woesearchaeota archaeon]|nr:hypothetical protein [Candidatus Woesearchaeota archaeon]
MTKWTYQYRAFVGQEPTSLVDALDKEKDFSKSRKSTIDTYVVGPSQVSARVRDGQLKMRGPTGSVDALVFELTDERYSFPVASETIAKAIGVKPDFTSKHLKTVGDLERWAEKKGAIVAEVKKQTKKYETPTCEVEVTEVDIEGKNLYTVAVASNDVGKIHSTLNTYGIPQIPRSRIMDYAEAIRQTVKDRQLSKA